MFAQMRQTILSQCMSFSAEGFFRPAVPLEGLGGDEGAGVEGLSRSKAVRLIFMPYT